MDAREAPSEYRIEISCARSVVRESSRAAILVQAIKSSSVTEPNRTQRERRDPATTLSFKSSISAVRSLSVAGNCLPGGSGPRRGRRAHAEA